ncbi:bifunctional phosphatase/dolichol-phosphate glucosyltransferase [Palaeococcus pacificus DY20341]|uniref:Bifunctional phosphatase/dolichol-phosphate glucosyltransferase n=1 Tax=Palaeococcus pacificus DY20341 TaxID=1343739 RepID=A0A075LV94_9EURY|nr:glycosyltransferase [Palaeococcus pacificus]AIF70066.1 bifunctional phosphatase/dolichol-phosphate glucosyltransferase [Palaeococcus pacificus DY20341]
MDIRLAIFDLDGTLIGAPINFQQIKEELKERLLQLGISKEVVSDLTPMYESLFRIAEQTGRDVDELKKVLEELEIRRIQQSFIFDGVKELLEFLKSKNIKMAIMTRNCRNGTILALEMHGIKDYFDLIVTRDDLPLEDIKPNDGHIKTILEHFGVPPTKAVVIGDHGYDVIPAKKAGTLSILITSHESGRMSFSVEEEPSFEVPTIRDAIPLFKRLLKAYVVIPAYNEEKTIGRVLDDLKAYFKAEHLVVVNDGSNDRTPEIAKSKGVHVLTHVVNRGLGGALGTGIAYALKKGAELIITFDADGQHLVSDALKVMKPVAEGRADFAVGSRLKGDISEMPFVKRFGNFVLDSITALFASKYVSDSQSGLRCFNRECASKIKITCDRYAVSSEIIIEVSKNRCKIIEVPIKAIYTDYAAKKGTNVLEGVKIALNLLIDKLR